MVRKLLSRTVKANDGPSMSACEGFEDKFGQFAPNCRIPDQVIVLSTTIKHGDCNFNPAM